MELIVEFVGRSAELQVLEDAWRAPGSAFVPVYGRRRVGKSELLLRFLAGKRAVYYVGKQAPAALQMREFLAEAAVSLAAPLLASARFASWKEALEAVVQAAGGRRLALALDEFQWMAGTSPELPSVLQALWDRQWRESGKIALVLCGSFVGFMEREVLGRKSPLYGRRTAQIHLKPFGYREAALFHPACSLEDRARTYLLCGGIPLHLRLFSADRSLEMNVVAAILDDYAPLRHEPEFLLREELRGVENYYAILLELASGSRTMRELGERTGIGQSIHYHLDQLESIGYIVRRWPLVAGKRPARRVRFVLGDPLLRFWFRFVWPNQTFLQQHGAVRTWRERIRPEIDGYFGSRFESLCREALAGIYRREGVHAGFEIGEYWDRATQIDLVGLRDDGVVDLGECKWGPVGSARELENDLRSRAARYPNPRGATFSLRAFVRRRGATRAAPATSAIRWHTLADLYGEG